jgi:hypothetical protein
MNASLNFDSWSFLHTFSVTPLLRYFALFQLWVVFSSVFKDFFACTITTLLTISSQRSSITSGNLSGSFNLVNGVLFHPSLCWRRTLWSFLPRRLIYIPQELEILLKETVRTMDYRCEDGTPWSPVIGQCPESWTTHISLGTWQVQKVLIQKCQDFKGSKAFISAIFEFVKFPTRYAWSNIRISIQY